MASRSSRWSWNICPERRVSVVAMAGIVTWTDALDAQDDLAADRRFDPSFGLIVDLRLVSQLLLTVAEAKTIVRHSPVALQAPRAFVATTIATAAIAHACRAVRTRTTGTDVVLVCGSRLDALEWVVRRSGATDEFRRSVQPGSWRFAKSFLHN
ncbi:MAG TPA: hypothetical protein VKD69_07720 [Vicinamibacterales bacterium]|nr:hypothetical protein [Vicinamibacterales bacterium]